jgi:hypothetical protein
MKTAQEMAAILQACGIEMLTVSQFAARFAVLGYTLDRSLDCRAPARILTGDFAGISYPCCTTGLKETDTGRSAFRYQARRDQNFKAMQTLRNQIAAISRNAILEV